MDIAALEKLAEAAEGVEFTAEGFEQTIGNGQFYGGLIMHANGHTIVAQCVLQPWADFIAAANPAAILSLIASHDQLVAALIGARESVQANRDALYECHYEPHTGDVDAEGRDAVDAEDALLSRIDAALKTAGAA